MIVESPSSRATVLVDTTASTTIRRGTKEEGDGHATEVTAADEYTGKRRNTWSPSSPSSSSSSSSVHAGPQCTLSRDKRRPHAVSDSLRAQEARDCNTPSESLLGNSQPTTRPSTVAALTPPSMTPSGVMPASRKGDNSDNTTVTLKMEERKLFLGGLPYNCGQRELKEYFSQFGDIDDATVMIDHLTGRSRGFGFITFQYSQDMEVCLDNIPHVVMDKTIDVKRAVEGGLGPRGSRHHHQQHQQGSHTVVYKGSTIGSWMSGGGDDDMKGSWSRHTNHYYFYGRGVFGGGGKGGYRGYGGGKGGGGKGALSSSSLPYRVPDDPCKVFIGGLPPSADDDSLTDMLAQYGTLVDCNVMIDRGTGRNRGFAYATFSTPAGANAACRGGDNNMMDGKWVEVKPCTRLEFPSMDTSKPTSSTVYGCQQQQSQKDEPPSQAGPKPQHHHQQQQQQKEFSDDPCKVFLGGLPQSADQNRVTEYLSQYGDVQDVTVMYDRNTGRHRGFAYATFGNDKDAVAAINGDNVIDGKWVQVKPSSRSMEHVGKAFQSTTQQTGGTYYRNGSGNSSSSYSSKTPAVGNAVYYRSHRQRIPPPPPPSSSYRREGRWRWRDTSPSAGSSWRRQETKQEELKGEQQQQEQQQHAEGVDEDGDQQQGDMQQRDDDPLQGIGRGLSPIDKQQSQKDEEEEDRGNSEEEPPPEAATTGGGRQEGGVTVVNSGDGAESGQQVLESVSTPQYENTVPDKTTTPSPSTRQQQQQQSTTATSSSLPAPPPPPPPPPPPGTFIPMNQEVVPQQLGMAYPSPSQYVLPSTTGGSTHIRPQQSMMLPPSTTGPYNGITRPFYHHHPQQQQPPQAYAQPPAFSPMPPTTSYSTQQPPPGMVPVLQPSSSQQQQYVMTQMLPSPHGHQRFPPQLPYPVGPITNPPTSTGMGFMPPPMGGPMFGAFQYAQQQQPPQEPTQGPHQQQQYRSGPY